MHILCVRLLDTGFCFRRNLMFQYIEYETRVDTLVLMVYEFALLSFAVRGESNL